MTGPDPAAASQADLSQDSLTLGSELASLGLSPSPKSVDAESSPAARSQQLRALDVAKLAKEVETAKVAHLQAELRLQQARMDASDYSYPDPPTNRSSSASGSPRSVSPTSQAAFEVNRLELLVRAEELKLEQEKIKLEHARVRRDHDQAIQASRPGSPTAQTNASVPAAKADPVRKLITDHPSFDGTGCPDTWLHNLMRALLKHEVPECRWAAVMQLKMTGSADQWLAATYASGQAPSFERLSSDFLYAFGRPWTGANAYAQLSRLEGPWNNIVQRDQLNESRLALKGIPRDPCPAERTWYRLQIAMETADPARAATLLQQLDALPATSEHRLREIEASERAEQLLQQQDRRQSGLPRALRSPERSALFAERIKELERRTKTLPAAISTIPMGGRRVSGVAQAAAVTALEDDLSGPGDALSGFVPSFAVSPPPPIDPVPIATMEQVRLATVAVMEGRVARAAASKGSGGQPYPLYGKVEFLRRRDKLLCFGCDKNHEKGKDPGTGDVWTYMSCRSHGPLATAEDRKAAAAWTVKGYGGLNGKGK